MLAVLASSVSFLSRTLDRTYEIEYGKDGPDGDDNDIDDDYHGDSADMMIMMMTITSDKHYQFSLASIHYKKSTNK